MGKATPTGMMIELLTLAVSALALALKEREPDEAAHIQQLRALSIEHLARWRNIDTRTGLYALYRSGVTMERVLQITPEFYVWSKEPASAAHRVLADSYILLSQLPGMPTIPPPPPPLKKLG
jgi:hypothetical protein